MLNGRVQGSSGEVRLAVLNGEYREAGAEGMEGVAALQWGAGGSWGVRHKRGSKERY